MGLKRPVSTPRRVKATEVSAALQWKVSRIGLKKTENP
jgi:hypothetical protein